MPWLFQRSPAFPVVRPKRCYVAPEVKNRNLAFCSQIPLPEDRKNYASLALSNLSAICQTKDITSTRSEIYCPRPNRKVPYLPWHRIRLGRPSGFEDPCKVRFTTG